MNKTIYFLVLLLSAISVHAQPKLFSENKQGGYIIYATNAELFPVSIDLDLSLTNLNFSEGAKTLFVLPAKSEKLKIGELTAASGGAYKFSWRYKYTMGDVTAAGNYNKSYEYDLPFQKGKSFKVFQGYNGTFSHQNQNAIDFTMPEGTEILAAREGKVVKVVQNNNQSCLKQECKEYNNYVTIMHDDGSFASYLHLKYNGSKVKPGDVVKKGDVIAYSGNTGWSSGPHLHFECFTGGFERKNTLETKFRTGNGVQATTLQEGTVYTREY